MIIKHKHRIKNKTINNIVLRFQRKGCKLYPVFSLVILHRKSRANKGLVLDKLGGYNPNFNERFFFLIVLNYIIDLSMV